MTIHGMSFAISDSSRPCRDAYPEGSAASENRSLSGSEAGLTSRAEPHIPSDRMGMILITRSPFMLLADRLVAFCPALVCCVGSIDRIPTCLAGCRAERPAKTIIR
jgi:hypothetical protein